MPAEPDEPAKTTGDEKPAGEPAEVPKKLLSIMDAGPCITFCAVNQESMLYDILSRKYQLSAPDVVEDEVLRIVHKSKDYKAVPSGWRKLKGADRVQIIPSPISDKELAAEVILLSGVPLAQRLLQKKDLGELLAIAHARIRIRHGETVHLLIDDGKGAKLAHKLKIETISTITILRTAILRGYFEDRGKLKNLYERMRRVDDGLVHIDATTLLDKKLWDRAKAMREAEEAQRDAEKG